MTHDQIVYALNTLYPNALWQLNGNNFNDLIWLDEKIEKPLELQIENEIANPTPRPELSVQEKLASVGLSIEELRIALGGN